MRYPAARNGADRTSGWWSTCTSRSPGERRVGGRRDRSKASCPPRRRLSAASRNISLRVRYRRPRGVPQGGDIPQGSSNVADVSGRYVDELTVASLLRPARPRKGAVGVQAREPGRGLARGRAPRGGDRKPRDRIIQGRDSLEVVEVRADARRQCSLSVKTSTSRDDPAALGEPMLVGVADCLCAVADAGLAKDSVDVCLHRRVADDERLGDLCVREPGGDQLQRLGLARSQVVG